MILYHLGLGGVSMLLISGQHIHIVTICLLCNIIVGCSAQLVLATLPILTWYKRGMEKKVNKQATKRNKSANHRDTHKTTRRRMEKNSGRTNDNTKKVLTSIV